MNYVVAIPLDPALADLLGKRSTENGMIFYNRKLSGDDDIIGIAPSSIEEKFHAMGGAMLLADQILLSTSVVDKLFGEVLLASSMLGKRVILTDDNDVTALLANSGLKNYTVASKEDMIGKITSVDPIDSKGETRVDIDKAFPVKGVGTVALGIVTSGTVKAKSELYHSNGKKVYIRSIQSHDVDVMEASRGTRVGLALKGIESDEIEKGDLLTGGNVGETTSVTAEITLNKLANEPIEKEKKYALISNFTYVFASITEVNGNRVTLRLDAMSSLMKGDTFLLIREKAPRIFAMGRIV